MNDLMDKMNNSEDLPLQQLEQLLTSLQKGDYSTGLRLQSDMQMGNASVWVIGLKRMIDLLKIMQ